MADPASLSALIPAAPLPAADLLVARGAASLRHQVEDRLRQAIVSGRFAPRQHLVERELCAALSVSRPLLREALRQLEAEGLISLVPHKGPMVTGISAAEAAELYDLRALLEGFAGEALAARHDAAAIARLGAAVAGLETAAAAGDAGAVVAAKAVFYAALLEGCGNRFVQESLSRLHNRITVLRATSLAEPGRLRHSLREIGRIYRCIEAGDAAGAGRACRRHIAAAKAVALAVLARTPEVPGQ